jgi:glutathione synthase/RimK-type ligase-like ATP-grasp enzyme
VILRSAAALEERFEELGGGDTFIGRLPARYLQPAPAADLVGRGVRCLPSVLCQLLARSKCAQALLLKPWMAFPTRVIARRTELLAALQAFAQEGIAAVVTKQEGMHCGHGVRRWESAETLYNAVSLCDGMYPFVLQPFMNGVADVRVIIAGDHIEAYRRDNPFNFRANLAAGGSSRPVALGPRPLTICREVMARGRFPYAHIDLQLMPDGACFLSEIGLDGGITGARIGREALSAIKNEVLERLAE